MTLQFGASLTDDTRSVNYDRNTFIIQATGLVSQYKTKVEMTGYDEDVLISNYKCKKFYSVKPWGQFS